MSWLFELTFGAGPSNWPSELVLQVGSSSHPSLALRVARLNWTESAALDIVGELKPY